MAKRLEKVQSTRDDAWLREKAKAKAEYQGWWGRKGGKLLRYQVLAGRFQQGKGLSS